MMKCFYVVFLDTSSTVVEFHFIMKFLDIFPVPVCYLLVTVTYTRFSYFRENVARCVMICVGHSRKLGSKP